jgi:uncharacterized protein YukE
MPGKATFEQKARYSEEIKRYREQIGELNERIRKLESAAKKKKDNPLHPYQAIALANEYASLTSQYTSMSTLSQQLLGVKNEGYLNTARKNLYKILIFLEDVFGKVPDQPMTENDELFEKIPEFNDSRRLNLARRIGLGIQSVLEGFGEGSKWKWSFVEIEGRFATAVKNMTNWKSVMGKMDPRVPGFQERQEIRRLAIRLLRTASNRYREKYELSTRESDDLKHAIDYLRALRQIHILFNEAEEANNCKKGIDVWKNKLDDDMKKKEEEKKKREE